MYYYLCVIVLQTGQIFFDKGSKIVIISTHRYGFHYNMYHFHINVWWRMVLEHDEWAVLHIDFYSFPIQMNTIIVQFEINHNK